MEMSASSSKKRKLISREEEQEDEAKMEKFFALVRNIRETRDRWMGLKSGERKSKRGEIVRWKEEDRVGVWKPTFQVEDFADEEAQRETVSDPCASQRENFEKKEAAEKGIDLSLSL